MFNQIQGAANRGEIVAKGKRMTFPKVEQIVTLAGHFGHNNQIDLEDQIAEEQTKTPIDSLEISLERVNYDKMAWGELRKHAASKGIKVKGLRRGSIISKLKLL